MRKTISVILICVTAFLCVREITRAWITVAAIETGKINPLKK